LPLLPYTTLFRSRLSPPFLGEAFLRNDPLAAEEFGSLHADRRHSYRNLHRHLHSHSLRQIPQALRSRSRGNFDGGNRRSHRIRSSFGYQLASARSSAWNAHHRFITTRSRILRMGGTTHREICGRPSLPHVRPLAAIAVNGVLLYLKNRTFLHRDAMKRHRQKPLLDLRSPSEAVKDRGLLRVSLVSLVLAVSFLVVHTFLGVSAALATLLPAFLILVYESSRSNEVQHVLGRIDWQIFFFFGGLFILVAALGKTGVLSMLGSEMLQVSGGNLALSVTLVLWVTALVSQVVDNVPLATVFIPVIAAMANTLSVPIAPLAWALAIGTGMGGMATPIGTASNLVALNILNKPRQRLSFVRFAKRSIPLTIIDLAIANLILLLRLLADRDECGVGV